MTLTLDAILRSAGIDSAETQVIRHAFVKEHEDTGLQGIHAASTDEEILVYTSQQSAKPRIFPVVPPRTWVVFVRDGGDRARLWAVLENRGEISNDGALRSFDLVVSEKLADLRNRLVIGWRSPRAWRLNGPTAAGYPVMEIADAQPLPFPGFDRLVLDHALLQSVMREHRYASWRTALVGGGHLPDHRHPRRAAVCRQSRRDGEHSAALGRVCGQRSRWQRRASRPRPCRIPLLAAASLRPSDAEAGDL